MKSMDFLCVFNVSMFDLFNNKNVVFFHVVFIYLAFTKRIAAYCILPVAKIDR